VTEEKGNVVINFALFSSTPPSHWCDPYRACAIFLFRIYDVRFDLLLILEALLSLPNNRWKRNLGRMKKDGGRARTDVMQGAPRYASSFIRIYLEHTFWHYAGMTWNVYNIVTLLMKYINVIASVEVILSSVEVTPRSFWFIFLLLLEEHFSFGKQANRTGPFKSVKANNDC
jgi:hypothetical protein